MSEKIAIIGAGVGGLATAARLAKRGFDVEVFEKLPECGGRAHIIEDSGFKFDTGPSFVLMPDFFSEVFSDCGEDINNYLKLKTLETSYKIFYADQDMLTIYRESEETKNELEKIEPGSSQAFNKFIKGTGEIYNSVRPLLYKCFTKSDLFDTSYWPLLAKLKVGKSYWQIARKYFKSDKLCYAFTFEAMFMGVSPFQTPAFYSIISYADHVQKILHPIGGMYQIPKALERLAQKFGARFNYNTEVENIRKGEQGIILKTKFGEIEVDRVVVNADYSYAQTDLLKRKIPKYKYSCSTYLMYLGLKKKISGLAHHNLFFAKDIRRNLKDIFNNKVLGDDFSFYVHAPTVTDATLAPAGKDILYILVPVPNLENSNIDFSKEEDRIRNIVFGKINDTLGVKIQDMTEVEHRFLPVDFIKRYNIKHGATFGLSHNLLQSAFFRPPNFDKEINNLYYVGASTQPGGGLPPVIASSKIVSDLIQSLQS